MSDQNTCHSCESPIKVGAKFCPSCGAKIEQESANPETTMSSVVDFLRVECEELDDGVFKTLVPIRDGRSQIVFVIPVEDENGETGLDDLVIWSNFALANKVKVKEVLALDLGGLGIQQLGDYLAVQTAIRPWQLRNLDALAWIITRVGLIADNLEELLLGTDDF